MTSLPAVDRDTSARDPWAWWRRVRPRAEPWLPPVLALVAWAIGAATVGVLLTPTAVVRSAVLVLGLVGFRILLPRIGDRLRPGSRAVILIFVAHQAVLLAAIVANPFLCIYAFIGYLDAVRWFVGRQTMIMVVVTGVWCAVGQTGGIPGISGLPVLFGALTMINIGVAAAMLQISRDHERQVEARERAAEELARVTRDNLALHEELVAQAHATGVAQERARLSREIHDTVAQGLVAVIRQLEAVPVDGADPEARERIDRAEETARDCLVEARRAVEALAPQQLDDAGLVGALEGVVRRWSRSHRIVCQLDTDDAPAHVEAEATLVRVAQEALSNVARHARASTVTVRLFAEGGAAVLEVFDDGRGVDPRDHRAGRGLTGMAERLAVVGGSVEVGPGPSGTGTTLLATVPATVPATTPTTRAGR